jgi:signal transduction histidine kinase
MVPVICGEAVAAIGAYWARRHRPDAAAVRDLEDLAGLASVAFTNVKLDAELRAAVRARDEFIAIASHELRSPLTAAQLQLGVAARALAGPDPSRARGAVERAGRSAARLGRLVEGLLDVSRLLESRLVLEREPVALADLVRAVAARVADAHRGADVRVDAEDGPCGAWDRLRIEQVVENLVANAVKFGGDAPVEVRVRADGDAALLFVADRGIGIAAEDQARIFEPFERAVSSRHYGGFGLGLWIARQAVEAHGGTIAVESRPGAGSTFTVRLPLR